MSNQANAVYQITALDFAKCVVNSQRLAIDATVLQIQDLAGAIIQQDQTIKIQNDQIYALCTELNAYKNKV